MQIKVLFWCLVLFPFVVMVLVNEINETPVETYDPARCTRYCHSHACLHAAKKYEHNQSPFIKKSTALYESTIRWLGHSSTGLRYRDMNLALFVGGLPLAMSILLWGAIRKKSKTEEK